jgi:hypothetical protein
VAGLHCFIKIKGTIMKKVMLFIVSMLFAVSASAATVTLSGPGLPGTPSNGQLAIGTGDNVAVDFGVQTDAPTAARFTFAFNPETGPLSKVGFYADGSLVGTMYTAILGANASTLSFIQQLVLGVTYSLKAFTAQGALITATSAAVSAVPVPAALFLFAPALLGLFGLRRKSASTSVVAA